MTPIKSAVSPAIKVCGLTRMHDVDLCVALGVEAIGLNFWPKTPRCVDEAFARDVRMRHPTIELVGVFVDQDRDLLVRLRDAVGLDQLQLHGEESPEMLETLLPGAYKAIGVAGEDDVQRAAAYGGQRLLLDARVAGAMPGGTGHAFDWKLATALARTRELTLAGGLHPANVQAAIATVRPARIDVASGVESAPGLKDPAKVRSFVEAVRA